MTTLSRTATTVSRVSSAEFTELTTSTMLALPATAWVEAFSPALMELMESFTAPERKSEKLAPGAPAAEDVAAAEEAPPILATD